MKKLILSAIIAISAVFSANAQFWAGGSIGFTHDEGANMFGFSPEVGYTFNGGPWSVAGALDLSFSGGSVVVGLTPYARYTFWNSGVASLFVDGYLNFRYSKDSYGPAYYDDLEDYLDDINYALDSDTFRFGIGVKPGIAIALSPKLSLVSHLGNLGLGLTRYIDAEETGVDFKIGADGYVGSIGLYYTF